MPVSKYAAALIASMLVMAGPVMAQGFPDGPDKAMVEQKCTGCHVGTQVTTQRRTPAQWAETVEKMASFGASISDDEFEKIVAYLSKNFGPEGAAAPTGGN